MTSDTIPITCTLDSGATVTFDAPHPEADDHDATHLLYELFVRVVGG